MLQEATRTDNDTPEGLTDPLGALARRIIEKGNLILVDGNGGRRRFGDGTGPEVVVHTKPAAALRIAAKADLAFGECYMDGSLSLGSGDIHQLLDLIFRNPAAAQAASPPINRLRLGILRRMQQLNGRHLARSNVAHHYDLSYDLYRRFLDADMQYSCAYFRDAGQSLEAAQLAKKHHLIAKLLLEPGQSVLDIGCGWGGLAREIAAAEDVQVDGVTLSTEQLDVARARAPSDKLRFHLKDYRDLDGSYDRIVSVGMFEHVGVPNYDEYFATVARLLKDGGVAVVHSIGRKDGPNLTNPWIAKYIFPGGYIPSLSEVLPSIEKAGLWVTDIEILRLHYAETLRHWRERFLAERSAVREIYDERFCRMWEFYLAASEAAFRHQGHMVFQIQLAKSVDSVPLTRDYIGAAEAILSKRRLNSATVAPTP